MKPELVPHGGHTEQLGAVATAEGVNFGVYSESSSARWVSQMLSRPKRSQAQALP